MANLPEPFSPTEQYLAAVLAELRQLNQHLAPTVLAAPAEIVELREPGPQAEADEKPKPAPKKRKPTKKKAS